MAAEVPIAVAAAPASALPERAAVHWRPPMDAERLRRRGTLWTLTTIAHVVPFVMAGVVLFLVQPLAVAVSLASFAHAWIIPTLYAARGTNVLRPKRRGAGGGAAAAARIDPGAAATAVGLLGDLLDHHARDTYAQTGLVVERGALGVWVLGEAGAALLTARGRRATCFCVRVDDPDLPPADRTAHLLLALRADEVGFATVANMAFSGARWRIARRLPREMRPALDAAARLDRLYDRPS